MTTNCKIELTGTVSRAPIMTSKGSKRFVFVTIATRDTFIHAFDGTKKERTLYHEVTGFTKGVVPVMEDLRANDKVHLVGTLSYKPFEAKDGFKRSQASIIATEIKVID